MPSADLSPEGWEIEIRELVQRRRVAEAKARLAKAWTVFPDHAGFAMTLGAVLCRDALDERALSARMGRDRRALIADGFAKAVVACRAAIRLGIDRWEVHFHLGVALRGLGRPAEAAAFLARAYACRADAGTAGSLLEAAVMTHGIGFGRRLHAGLAADHATDAPFVAALAEAWARLLFEAGLTGEVEAVGSGYRCCRLTSVPDWAGAAGVVTVFSGASEEIPVEDPRMIGGPPVTLFKGVVRGYRPYACAVPDAIVLSKSDMVLTADGAALNDVATDPRFGRFVEFFHDRAVVLRRDGHILIDPRGYRIEDIDGGIMLSGGSSANFGHWIPEFLCRLPALMEHPAFAELPIIVDQVMPPSHVEYLRLLVDNVILPLPDGGGFRCRRLLVAPPPTFFPVHSTIGHPIPEHEQGPFSPRCFRFLRDRVAARLPPAGARNRRIHLSRRKRYWRHLLNEDEIGAALHREGFETIHPEDLTLVEQVRLFQQAEAIVSPSGSCLINLVFAHPSVRLLVLNQPHMFSLNGFYGPMRALGYEPVVVCGEGGNAADKHAPFSVPVARVLEGLERIGLR